MGRQLVAWLIFLTFCSVTCSAQQSTVLFFRKDPTVEGLFLSKLGIYHNDRVVAKVARNNIAFYHPDSTNVTLYAKTLDKIYNKRRKFGINMNNESFTFVEIRIKYPLIGLMKTSFTVLTKEQFKAVYNKRKKLRKKLRKVGFASVEALYKVKQ